VTSAPRAAGWHPDETDAALLRYWDGSGWTPHTTRADAAAEALHRTVRLEPGPPDHTTVPTPPAVATGRFAARPAALPSGGSVTAAAALVVATAALAVALLG
jgi:hypothetical protein